MKMKFDQRKHCPMITSAMLTVAEGFYTYLPKRGKLRISKVCTEIVSVQSIMEGMGRF
jgi:hypothetical protein